MARRYSPEELRAPPPEALTKGVLEEVVRRLVKQTIHEGLPGTPSEEEIIAPFIGISELAPAVWITYDSNNNPVLVGLASADTYNPKNNTTGTRRWHLDNNALSLTPVGSDASGRLDWDDGVTEYGYEYFLQTASVRERASRARVVDKTSSRNAFRWELRENDDSAVLYALRFVRDYSGAVASRFGIGVADPTEFDVYRFPLVSPFNPEFRGGANADIRQVLATAATSTSRTATFPDATGIVALTGNYLASGSSTTTLDSSITATNFSETVASLTITVPTGRTATIIAWAVMHGSNNNTRNQVARLRVEIGANTGFGHGEGGAASEVVCISATNLTTGNAAGSVTVAATARVETGGDTFTVNGISLRALALIDG